MKDYIVFILSHENVNFNTLKSLRESGYTGDYRIIVDDKDSEMEKYLEKYSDKVEIFSKKNMSKSFDIMNNFEEYKGPTYARNFCFGLAEKLGYKYFIQIDDDISKFLYVFTEGEKFKKLQIKNLDIVFENIIKYLNETNCSIFAFSQNGGNFGGPKGRYSKCIGRSVSQCMIINSNKECRFVGQNNQDFNISIKHFNDVTLEFFCLAVNSPQRGANSNMYKNVGFYKCSYYSFMLRPSGVKLSIKNGHFTIKRYSRKLFPKILSDSWKLN